ncbi:MAG: FkbM family methyltransferase [Bryobacterales bacterium]|nr:FkbM family methyltransferase [Bryobacterales bacterium]
MKKAILAIVIVLAGAVVVGRIAAPAQAEIVLMAVQGKSPHCPLSLALNSPAEHLEQEAVKDAYIERLKLGASDPGFERWDLPASGGEAGHSFWIPAGNRWVLPFNLAEQFRDIYRTKEADGIREGDVVLDCGAHVGTFTHFALARGAGKVIAIEPSPRNVECLRRNFPKEIAEGRVIVYPKGVWNKDDVLVLEQVGENSAADTVVMHQPGARKGTEVPLTTIDKLVAELGLERVDYIKMDIEGAEAPALEGAAATLNRWKPRLALASYHKEDDPIVLPATVSKLAEGYEHRCTSCVSDQYGSRPEVLLFKAKP